MLSLACQLDNSCPVAARELLHKTKWTLLFWCTLTTQCIKFVLLQLRDYLGGSSPWLCPLFQRARQFIGQSEAFRVPMPGTWQVTRRKNVSFCHNWVWHKICSAPSPLSVYSSSCHCICIKKCKTWIWSAYKYDKYAKICTPLCWWCFAVDGALPLQVGVGLTWMATTTCGRRLFCSGTFCGWGYHLEGWDMLYYIHFMLCTTFVT